MECVCVCVKARKTGTVREEDRGVPLPNAESISANHFRNLCASVCGLIISRIVYKLETLFSVLLRTQGRAVAHVMLFGWISFNQYHKEEGTQTTHTPSICLVAYGVALYWD